MNGIGRIIFAPKFVTVMSQHLNHIYYLFCFFKFFSWKRNVIQKYCCSPQSSAQNWAYSRPDWTRLSWCYRRCIGPGGRCDRWLAEKVAAPTALWRLSTNQRQAVKMRRDESGCFSHFSGRQLPLPFFFLFMHSAHWARLVINNNCLIIMRLKKLVKL